ncbi:hypothetical protein [Shivajiella indica]|uniref:Uncharacterized protein n=1 Tax=Shivajiella indica TaxID=872115 RepID=A0ABW5BBR6_9BACT
MKRNWLTLLFMALLLGFIPISSCVDQCNGPCGCYPVYENQEFTITTFSTETLFRADRNFLVDPNRFYFHQTLYKAFWVSGLRELTVNVKPHFNSLFSNSAYACSPAASFSEETLKTIRLINKKPIRVNENEFLEIGDIINEKFILTQNFQMERKIVDFLSTNHRFQKNERLYLKFTSKPDSDIEIMFDIEIELDNGIVHIFNNETMKINGG